MENTNDNVLDIHRTEVHGNFILSDDKKKILDPGVEATRSKEECVCNKSEIKGLL